MSETSEKPIRLGVLLSGGGRTLLNILEKIGAGELPAEVAVVIASRDCRGVERSRRAGLNVHVVPYKRYKAAGKRWVVDDSREFKSLSDADAVKHGLWPTSPLLS